MIKRIVILFLFLSITFSESFAQDAVRDNLLRETVAKYGQAEVSIPYPGYSATNLISAKVSISSVSDKIVYITLSPLTVNWFVSQNFNYTIIERQAGKGIVSASSMKMAMDWQTYPTYTQYDSIMKSFRDTYPGLCRLDTVGTSINGRLVLALKISDNVLSDEDEPELFYTSSMHGDETGGYVLMLRLAEYLLKNYGTDSRAKNLVDNLEIWINPLANPDGTYYSGNTISSPIRWNANYIDLNRNFPDPLDLSIVPEKENVDMIKFMRKHHFVISANFHAGAEVVNYPWDRWYSKIHADDAWFNQISRAYADTVHVYSGPFYLNDLDNGVTRGAVWYTIEGGRQDFVTWELHGREVTIELDGTDLTPAAQLELLWQNNYRSLLGYLENGLYGVHGLVRNSANSAPVAAKVYISGHDKDSSQVYSDTLSGKFTRYLFPGTWSVSFSANGYRDTTVTGVIVISGQKTDLIVDMKPITTTIDTTDPVVPELFPNPATESLKCKLPDRISGTINIKVYSQSGMKVTDYNTEALFGIPVILDVSRMPSGAYIVVFKNKTTGISYRSRFIVTRHD